MPTNYTNLSMTMKVSITGTAQGTVVGQDYSAPSEPLAITKTIGPFSTKNANNAALGADETYSAITQIAAGGNATVNLQSFKDLLNQTGVSLARVKAYCVRLLSTADDSTVGSACTGVTFNGAGGTDLAVLPGLTNLTLGNGAAMAWGDPGASGVTISGTTNNIYIANNDGTHPASVQITVIGGTS